MKKKQIKIMRWLKLVSYTILSVDEEVVHLELSYPAGQSINWFKHCVKLFGRTAHS
jgi:hypothetical protein